MLLLIQIYQCILSKCSCATKCQSFGLHNPNIFLYKNITYRNPLKCLELSKWIRFPIFVLQIYFLIQQCVRICHPDRTEPNQTVQYRTELNRTVPYRTLPFWDLPFPRFGLKKTRHRSLKPYRFPLFREKRLPNRSKKTPFSVSVFYHEPYRAK